MGMSNGPDPLAKLAAEIKRSIAEANAILAQSKDSLGTVIVAETLADLQRALAILEARMRNRDVTE